MIHMSGPRDRPSIRFCERMEAAISKRPPPPSPPLSQTGDTAKQADTPLTRNLATLQWLAHPGFHIYRRIGREREWKRQKGKERKRWGNETKMSKSLNKKSCWNIDLTILEKKIHIFFSTCVISSSQRANNTLLVPCSLWEPCFQKPLSCGGWLCRAWLPQGLKPCWVGFHLLHKAY